MPNVGTYKILMDERWDLEDLYLFPHSFGDAYVFTYCFDSEAKALNADRINTALDEYPWKGGYSYLNLYFVLKRQVDPAERPTINAIQYASPGWIELLLNPDVAMQVAKSVGILLGTGVAAVEAFKRIDKVRLDIARTRKAAGVDSLRLEAEEVAALRQLCDETAKHIGFKSVDGLNRRTKNPETTLKLLMAHWRRLTVLAGYVKYGKVKLPVEPIEDRPTEP